MKKIEDLNFTDDYMFGEVMRDPEICTKILERILKIKVDHIEYPQLQKVIQPYYESKGVRLDVYLKDSDRVFDIEMQSSKPADISKRTRYYQCMVDIDSLAKGNPYETLPDSYIIFFCKKDWLGNDLPVATYKTFCKENKDILFNDGSTKILLAAELWEKESDIATKDFLKYLYTCKATDELTTEIDNKVALTKLNELFRNDYLRMNLHDHDLIYKAKNEGIKEGIKEGAFQNKLENAERLLKMNILTVEQISEATTLTVEEIRKIKLQK